MEGFRRSLKQLSESRCGFAPSDAWPLDLSWTPAHHPSFPSQIWALTRQEAMRSAKRYAVCLIQCANVPSCFLRLSEKLIGLLLWFVFCLCHSLWRSQLSSITPGGFFVTLQSAKPEMQVSVHQHAPGLWHSWQSVCRAGIETLFCQDQWDARIHYCKQRAIMLFTWRVGFYSRQSIQAQWSWELRATIWINIKWRKSRKSSSAEAKNN